MSALQSTTDYLCRAQRGELEEPHEWLSLIQSENVVIEMRNGDGCPWYAAHTNETYVGFDDGARTLRSLGWGIVSLSEHIRKCERSMRGGVEPVEPWKTPLKDLFNSPY